MARFKGDAEVVRKFLSVLNSLQQSIRFTVEFEDHKVLNFLDVTPAGQIDVFGLPHAYSHQQLLVKVFASQSGSFQKRY